MSAAVPLDAHAALLAEYRSAVEELFDAKVVADWALASSKRLRRSALGMAPGSRMRRRTMMAALCRLEEADQALRAAEVASTRIGPLLDRLTGSERLFERAIERELEGERSGYVSSDEARAPERLDS